MIAYSSIIYVAKRWKQAKYPLTDEYIIKCSVPIQWNIIQPKKKWSIDTYYNVGDPQKQRANRKKPVTKITYYMILFK